MHDSLKHTLKKLQEQETENVKRIEALEGRLGAKVCRMIAIYMDVLSISCPSGYR